MYLNKRYRKLGKSPELFSNKDKKGAKFVVTMQQNGSAFRIYIKRNYICMQNKNNARNMYKANDIAHKIIKIGMIETNNGGELVTNLKLQKLLYYQQGFHLAVFGTPLFEEPIEAWAYGPVVPQVYQEYKESGNKGLEFNGETISLDEREENLFREVMDVYGSYSAIGLMNMTHSETPWKTTNVGSNSIITLEKMQHYFKTRLK